MPARFPRPIAAFLLKAQQFVNYLKTVPAGLSTHSPTRTTALNNALAALEAAVENKQIAAAADRAATQAQNDARRTLENLMSDEADFHEANPDITAAHLTGLGLNLPDTEPTAIGAPATHPVIEIDTSERFVHGFDFYDETANNTNSSAKPVGAASMEIWVAVTAAGVAPPASPDGFEYHSDDSASPGEVLHSAADAGKTAHYIGRWKTRTGLTGPWSATVSATITG